MLLVAMPALLIGNPPSPLIRMTEFQSMLPESSMTTSTFDGTPAICSSGVFDRLYGKATAPGGSGGGGGGCAMTSTRTT